MRSTTDKIAVIGIAGRYPGADNISEFWENLIKGKETITTFTDDVLSKFEINYNELKQNPNYVKARGILNDVDKFDVTFFGMTPKEASYTDPQHRVWLETAWNAFENAGIDPLTYKGAIGVYAGGYINTYLHNNILRDPEKLENFIRLRSADSFQIMTGNDVAFIPTKTAYKFNLRGPAVNVQTACSTSLVAIIQACQSLFSFESDVCLAGGVCVMTPQETGYIYQEGAIPSPDGHCRPFDANAKGTVFSNGVGAVVLKRLEDALTDRDRIYAVVSGWALNNDGNKKVSFMAPSVDGQAEAITMAQSFADITADEIGYIEAHGTGTHLGDPIEVAALTKAFSRNTNNKQYCGIGSVKSNIGHTDAAAGVAAFIKSCLSAYHKVIPPSINFSEPNPHIDFAATPFYVQSQLKEWNDEKPLVIGVSSFGIGGTNAHLIVEEAPKKDITGPIKQNWPNILMVSAKTEGALAARKENLVSTLRTENSSIEDIAYTLQFGRQHMSLRSFVVAKEFQDITEQKSLFVDGKVDEMQKSTCFVFPGQGAQYINMGRELYENSSTFRSIADEAFAIFKNITGEDLKTIIFSETDKELINQTKYTQPALFIIEYATARLFEELGIKPDTLIGHSIGEYPAACIAGVFDLETALKIVIKRGQLMQSMPSGKMLAVRSPLEALKNLNSSLFEIAAENSNSACTISLKHENLEKVSTLLTENKIEFIPLNTSHAFHSSAFDPILDEFSSFINQFNLNRPQIPFISCLTGDFIKDTDAVSGSYWAKQLRHTVFFNKGVSAIANRGNSVYIEMGPNTHLGSFIRANKLVTNKANVVFTLGKPDNIADTYKVIGTLGSLWNVGYDINFSNIYNYENCYKTTLPDYPFERKRCWIDYAPSANSSVAAPGIKEDKKPVKKETSTVSFDNNSRASLISAEIKKILCELSGNDINDLDSNMAFQDMGFDSLFLAQFARSIESNFKVPILFRQLASEFTTINKLSEYLNSKAINKNAIAEKEGITNLMYINRSGSKTPFILIHGGNSANFLPKYFNNERPVLNFFDLGSDGERIKFKNIDEMAMDYVNQVTTLIPKGPYIFCGFSFGGLLAHKMAQILQARNEQVPYIIMFDCKTPQAKEPGKIYKTLHLVKGNRLLFLMGAIKRKIKKINFYKIHLLLGNTLPTKFRSKYIFSVYLKLAKTYTPTKINSDLLIFRSLENHTYDRNLGWDNLVNNIDLCEITGDHLKILYIEENQKIISSEIRSFIDKHGNM